MVKPSNRMVKPVNGRCTSKKKAPKKEVWQRHHIRYAAGETHQTEWVVRVRRKVHFEATRLQRYKNFTWAEKQALIYIINTKSLLEEPHD